MIGHLSTEIETDILMETYKVHIFQKVVLLMSRCRGEGFIIVE